MLKFTGLKDISTRTITSPQWYCMGCAEDYSKHDKYHQYDTDTMSDEDWVRPNCICCGEKKLAWLVPQHEYVYQVWFDFAYQVYRDSNGGVVDTNQSECVDWDFPCNSCYGPAKLVSVDAHGEYHECKNCSHTFMVS